MQKTYWQLSAAFKIILNFLNPSSPSQMSSGRGPSWVTGPNCTFILQVSTGDWIKVNQMIHLMNNKFHTRCLWLIDLRKVNRFASRVEIAQRMKTIKLTWKPFRWILFFSLQYKITRAKCVFKFSFSFNKDEHSYGNLVSFSACVTVLGICNFIFRVAFVLHFFTFGLSVLSSSPLHVSHIRVFPFVLLALNYIFSWSLGPREIQSRIAGGPAWKIHPHPSCGQWQSHVTLLDGTREVASSFADLLGRASVGSVKMKICFFICQMC